MSEIQNHGKLGADLDDGGERGTRIGAQHQIAENTDMRAGGYREILGQRLNDAENDRLEKIHDPS